MINWKSGKTGKEQVERHKMLLIMAGYPQKSLHIQEWTEIVGEAGDKATLQTNYRVVAEQ